MPDTDGIPEPALVLSGPSPPDLFGPPGSMILSGRSPALRDIPGDPNLSPEDQAALQARLAYATGPGAPAWAQPKPAPQVPDELDPRMMQEAFSKLPIDQAMKATGAAIRFMGGRNYQKDLDAGVPADQALARNAPMMFWSPTGAGSATAMRAMMPPRMTPYQQGALGLARQRFQAQQDKPPMTAYQQQQIELAKQRLAAQQGKPLPMPPVDRALLGVDAADLRRTETEAAKAQAAVPTGIISKALHPFGGPQKAADALKAAAEAKRQELQQRYGRGATAAPATAAGTPKRFRYDRVTGKLVPLSAAAAPAATPSYAVGQLTLPDDEEQDYPE